MCVLSELFLNLQNEILLFDRHPSRFGEIDHFDIRHRGAGNVHSGTVQDASIMQKD